MSFEEVYVSHELLCVFLHYESWIPLYSRQVNLKISLQKAMITNLLTIYIALWEPTDLMAWLETTKNTYMNIHVCH